MQSNDVFYQVFSLGIKVLELGEIHKKIIVIIYKRFFLLTEIYRQPIKIENFNRLPTK